jgi:D-glycero-alpha-D-manno-heptose-7-phosphate kinase
MAESARPLEVAARAPLRICDIGGWTDTWFARYGRVVSLAVEPAVEVRVQVDEDGPPGVLVKTRERAPYRPASRAPWGPHPLIEATLASMAPLRGRIQVEVRSSVPPGAGTGTSAALAVALVGALDALTPGRLSPEEVARQAQRVETDVLLRQCGIQDQITSAHGGVCDIQMDEYPHSTTTALSVSGGTLEALDQGLALVYLGGAHDSSALHEQVIRDCTAKGPEHPALCALRRCAEEAAGALVAGDLRAYGRVMVANTEAQAALHPALVGKEAARVITLGREHGALGYKVNGAGGDGGSISLLTEPDPEQKDRLLRAILAEDPSFAAIEVGIARRGLTVEVRRYSRK